MSYAKLTKKPSSYGLPVIETFNRPKPVTVNGVQHPASIFRLWSDKELKAIGYARLEEERFDTHRYYSNNHTDTISNFKVIRTHDLVEKTAPISKDVDKMKKQVNSIRLEKINAGIKVNIANTEYDLETPLESRINITGTGSAITAGLPLPLDSNGAPSLNGTHISWRMANNHDVLMSGNEFISSIANAVLQHVNQCHYVSRAKKAELDTISTWNQIDQYKANNFITTGWPQTIEDEI